MERTNLTKYMADINASLANVQSTLDDLKTQVSEGFANQDELRRDDLRKVTARVAAIGNQVSYLRETVCNSLTNSVSHGVIGVIEEVYLINFFTYSVPRLRSPSRTATERRERR